MLYLYPGIVLSKIAIPIAVDMAIMSFGSLLCFYYNWSNYFIHKNAVNKL